MTVMLLFVCYVANSLSGRRYFYDNFLNNSSMLTGKKKKRRKRIIEFTSKDFVPIHSSFIDKNFFSDNHSKEIIEPLRKLGIIKVNDSYTPGSQSKGYFFDVDKFKDEPIIKYQLFGKNLVKKLENLNEKLLKLDFKTDPYAHKHLRDNLYKFAVDNNRLEDSRLVIHKKTKTNIETINSEDYRGEFKWWRFYSPYSNLNKLVRPYIYCKDYPNETLYEIDVKNSQLCFLLKYMELSDKDVFEIKNYYLGHQSFIKFKEVVLEGTIYDEIAKYYSISRDDAKTGVFRVLFSKHWRDSIIYNPKEVSNFDIEKQHQVKVSDYMNLKFIQVAQFIKYKKEMDSLNLFPMSLSRTESNFMIITVAKAIKHIPFITIHDSFIVPESFKDEVESTIQKLAEEKLGFKLPLKVKAILP